MKRTAIALSLSLLTALPGAALAQAGDDAHHPPSNMPAMRDMPEQCRAMMQAMSPECMDAMRQMTPGGMMQGMTMPPGADAAQAEGSLSASTRAYVEAMDAMHGPMMDGVMADDPDVAFVRGMIPHHQGAIDMARIVQQYGDDPQTRAWAEQIIAAQEREIAEMRAWLEANPD